LVREVSSSAVALLDLEPQEAPVQSGPVPFSSPSLGAGVGEPASGAAEPSGGPYGSPAAALGVFGPPVDPPHPPTAGADGLPGQ
ncbi:serine/threonine protein kinase, partial [Streptomyces sp. SID2563]|nr:serine/threonine protein kinase [Streptomyces sp. SID2563]